MDELFGRQSAVAEARALYRMIGDEHTVEEIGDRAGASRLDVPSNVAVAQRIWGTHSGRSNAQGEVASIARLNGESP